jgi:hypothetical protein
MRTSGYFSRQPSSEAASMRAASAEIRPGSDGTSSAAPTIRSGNERRVASMAAHSTATSDFPGSVHAHHNSFGGHTQPS